MVIALLAGCISIAFAYLGIHALVSFGPHNIPRLQEAGLNTGVLAFTFLIALLSAIIFGIAPTWRVWHTDPNDSLKVKSRGSSGSIGFVNVRSILVIVEFVLSVVLLTGSGLLIHSFLIVKAVDPGFEPEHVFHLSVSFPATGTAQNPFATTQSILDRLQAVPGVQAVGAIDSLFELGGADNLGLRSIEGRPPEPRKQWTALTWNTVRGDYFQAMGATLLHGRYFSGSDNKTSLLVAVIDESMARRYWKVEDPVGKRFKGQDRRGANDDWITVIGEVQDMRAHGLEKVATPHVYMWYLQSDDQTSDIAVRAAGDSKVMASELRSVVRSVAPSTPLSSVDTVQQELMQQLTPRRFQTSLVSLFSLLALVLATIGIYGLIHYSVVQRTKEIGIRFALGAQRGDILRLIVGQALAMATVGLGIGLMADWGVTRLLSGLLYGIAPFDPVTLAAVSIILFAVALLASFIPASRAANVDPMWSLRTE